MRKLFHNMTTKSQILVKNPTRPSTANDPEPIPNPAVCPHLTLSLTLARSLAEMLVTKAIAVIDNKQREKRVESVKKSYACRFTASTIVRSQETSNTKYDAKVDDS
jgi:hypothetical protein